MFFGRRKNETRKLSRTPRRRSLEQLEDRQMMTAAPIDSMDSNQLSTCTPAEAAPVQIDATGRLSIIGTEQADIIHIQIVDSDDRIYGPVPLPARQFVEVTIGSGDKQAMYCFARQQVVDILFAGHGGDDVLINETDVKLLADGGSGDDYIASGRGDDELQGGEGADYLDGGAGADRLFGQEGNDHLAGGGGPDLISGGAGNDRLYGGHGNDLLYGDEGQDVLNGGIGDDELQGGAGNDLLFGGAGGDRIFGQDGDDQLWDRDRRGLLDGGAGMDFINGLQEREPVSRDAAVASAIRDFSIHLQVDLQQIRVVSVEEIRRPGAVAGKLQRPAESTQGFRVRLSVELQNSTLNEITRFNAEYRTNGNGSVVEREGLTREFVDYILPTDFQLDNSTVTENAPGATIGVLNVSHPSLGNVEYSVDDRRFTVEGNVLKLRSDVALDHEAGSAVSVLISARPERGRPAQKTIVISVANINEAPVDLTLEGARVPENADGAAIGSVTVSDPDVGDSHMFRIADERFEVVAGQLKLKPGVSLDYEAEPTITTTITAIDAAGQQFEKSLTITVDDVAESAIRLELVRNVLVIRGTAENDNISVRTNRERNTLDVYELDRLAASFDLAGVRAIEVQALAGNDTVDLWGDGSQAVHVPAWIYGGAGADTLHGGRNNDFLFGWADDDTLRGHDGNDILYGGEGNNDVEGGAGADFISKSEGSPWAEIPAEDQDIENLPAADAARQYETRILFDQLNRYRDAFGFIVTLNSDGVPDDRGDAVIFTGLSAAMTALRGDGASTLALLTTLRDLPFVEEKGRLRLVRHPQIWDYIEGGDGFVRDRHAPLTKDGVLGVMTGAYYAYRGAYETEAMTTQVRQLAKEVLGKYIDYLSDNQWKTLDQYPDHYWDKDKNDAKKFAHVFSDETGRAVSWKGPESYALSPSDHFALKHIALELLPERAAEISQWNVWGAFAITLGQVAGNGHEALADSIAGAVGKLFDGFLQKISIHEDLSFHVIPGVSWTRVAFPVDVEISEPDRRNIVTFVEEAVRAYVSRYLNAGTEDLTELPVVASQFEQTLTATIDKVVDRLPASFGASVWRPLVADAIRQALPWFNGDAIGELIAFRLSHELAKTDEIVAHLSFWPTLLMYETRPDLADLLSLSVKDLDGYLNGPTADYENHRTDPEADSDFWVKSLYRMDMMLYAWLNHNGDKVDSWLDRFETDPRFENLKYAWKKPHEENVTDILAGDATGQRDVGKHRLDYLMLKQLDRRGVPDSTSDIVGDWVQHWRDVLDDFVAQVEEEWNNLRSNLAEFAHRLWVEFQPQLFQVADALYTGVTQNLPSIANALWDGVTHDLGAIASAVYEVADNHLGRTAKALWDGVTQNPRTVATALFNGPTRDLTRIAAALDRYASDNLSQVADALYELADHHLGKVARAMWDGATQNPVRLADALWSGATRDLTRIATALHRYTDSQLHETADAIYRIAGHLGKVANALHDGATNDPVEIAHALWNGVTHEVDRIAYSLYRYADTSFNDVAHALYEVTGSFRKVARGLWDGVSDDAVSIARALRRELDASFGQIVDALIRELGVSQRTVARILVQNLDASLTSAARALGISITAFRKLI
jgi:Ca2+-binding RTX toxin-like protein